jgi:hypothetical protein
LPLPPLPQLPPLLPPPQSLLLPPPLPLYQNVGRNGNNNNNNDDSGNNDDKEAMIGGLCMLVVRVVCAGCVYAAQPCCFGKLTKAYWGLPERSFQDDKLIEAAPQKQCFICIYDMMYV